MSDAMMRLGCTGEFGCDCPTRRAIEERKRKNLLGHGTPGKYKKGCRCPTCRKGNARRIREYRARKRES